MTEHRDAVESLALAIDRLRKLDRSLSREGFRGYSDSLREALAELENVRQIGVRTGPLVAALLREPAQPEGPPGRVEEE